MLLFLIAVAAETATRLWLASRQIAAVQAHRDSVPEPFQDQISLDDQRKATDYTVARVRLGRWAAIVEALMQGQSIGDIAESMQLNSKTVANHQSSIKRKLGADTAIQLLRKAAQLGLDQPG